MGMSVGWEAKLPEKGQRDGGLLREGGGNESEQGRASLEASGDWKEGSLGVCEEGKREPVATWPWFYAPSSKRED